MFGFKTNKDRLIQRLQAENAVLKRHINMLKAEVEYEKSTIVQVTCNKEPDDKASSPDNVVSIRRSSGFPKQGFLGGAAVAQDYLIVPRDETQDLSDY